MVRLVLAAVTLAGTLSGCTRSSPEAVVRALATAARQGDRAQVESLLGPETRRRVADQSRVASDQAGRRRLTPMDLLAVGWAPMIEEIDDVRELERSTDHAVLELVGKRGTRQNVEVVKLRGAWLVELP